MFVAAAFAGVGVLLVGLLLWLLSSSSQGRVVSMLVLTRKPIDGKSDIVLHTSDGDIVVRVNEVNRLNVRIAIDAPQSVRITRPEQRSETHEPVPA